MKILVSIVKMNILFKHVKTAIALHDMSLENLSRQCVATGAIFEKTIVAAEDRHTDRQTDTDAHDHNTFCVVVHDSRKM